MPKVSVLMPVFNTNPVYLRKAITSVLRQTFENFEFLILNDSPKNTQIDTIVNSYQDSRIKYIKSEKNLGIANAHNTLLKMAQGTYIAVMDHDDISLPDRFAKQYCYMESHPEVGICGTAYKRIGKLLKRKTIHHPIKHDDIYASLLFKCPMHHPSCMIRKSVLDRFHISYDTQFISCNDRKLYFDIAQHTQLHNLPDVLYKYRMHPQMTSKLRHEEIKNEQFEYRNMLLRKSGITLSDKEKHTLNTYILNGRCHIESQDILRDIERLLCKLLKYNSSKHFCNEKSLEKVCGKYLIKRCKNAALKGFISSKEVLENTQLPIQYPLWLKLFNRIRSKT